MVLDAIGGPDLLRLVAVPVLGWAAYRDIRTRRVPNRVWYPLFVAGAVALLWDGATLPAGGRPAFAVRVAVSLGVVVPMAYAVWRLGGFGGADAKALMALAVLYPTFPAVYLQEVALPLPAGRTTLGVFSLTVLTNAVVAGVCYPLALGARNLLAGRTGFVALVGRPVRWDAVEGTHGRLLETPGGYTRDGLDLDALRMYLRYRGMRLADLRADPGVRHARPEQPGDPTDGAVDAAADDRERPDQEATDDDPWGAATFIEDIEGDAYGTTPEQLRAGLELLVDRERVWVSPGIPFLVPLFVGLLAGWVYGDIIFGLLGALGLV